MEDLFKKQIPLMKPWLGNEEWEALKDIILSGWISQGPKVEEFEEAIATFVGSKYAIATNACTSALFLALVTQGIKEGDEVILPDFTCMANANAIIMSSAIPVFAEIDYKTYNIDPFKVEDYITEKTKAIMVVDQIGLPADMDKFIAISKKYNLVLIDDAATALGAKYKNKYLGGYGINTAFSFHPRKIITTGEGGMLLTDNSEIATTTRMLRSTGASVSDIERHKAKGTILQQYFTNGYNFRMTDVQAAIGIIQMKKLPEILKQRKEQANYYSEALATIDQIETPFVPEYADHAFSSYLLKIRKGNKLTPKDIITKMAEKNISCRFGIQPLHREPYFKNRKNSDHEYPIACNVADNSFFIPIFPGLPYDKIDYIINCLKDIFTKS
jgi:dTDP-4-amino-4,6-dideoxygalactose transaminase